MNIIKQDIGVWVKASEELPDKSSKYFVKCIHEDKDGENTWVTPDVPQISNYNYTLKEWHVNSKKITVTHWLKPIEQVYVLTGDELEHLLYEYLDDTFETAEQFLKSITTIK